MKILLCHNYYQQSGGEDSAFAAEAGLLEGKGHEVIRFTLHNNAIDQMGRLEVARRTLWNSESYRTLREVMRRERPRVMHCTNTFPLISPAAYSAAREEGVAVVQGLHNYRLFCANSLFLRDGRVCEDCLGKTVPWPALRHSCYRESRAATAVVAALQISLRLNRKWDRSVDLYIALTEFSRNKFIEGGIHPEQIAVKPNFVFPDPGPRPGRGGYLVFVGRLSNEKGIESLLAAWARLPRPVPLKIIGDGPMAHVVGQAVENIRGIEWLGRRSPKEVLAVIGDAEGLVVPSICYENFPRAIAEAFATGTPVIGSRMGAMAELVADGRTGVTYEPGNPDALAAAVVEFLADAPGRARMRQAARQEYEQKYTPEKNYRLLMTIYERAIAVRGLRPSPGPVETGGVPA
jgi:glycosyltransferase involved in cell wall biosynthesis